MMSRKFSILTIACVLISMGALLIGCSDDKPTQPEAAWSWSPLGTGMDSLVNDLTVYDNRLIAGGKFTTAGGVSANHIAACRVE